MDQLSQALNLGPQPMPSAYSRLHRRAPKSNPEKTDCIYTVSIHLRNLGGQLGAVQRHVRGRSRLYGGGRAAAPAKQIHTVSRPSIVRFGHKTASIVRKIYFIVRNGQSRIKNKSKTNFCREWLHSDCMITSLANKELCVGGLTGVDATCGQCRRSVSAVSVGATYATCANIAVPGLRNNLLQLPCIVPPLSLIDLERAPFLPYY